MTQITTSRSVDVPAAVAWDVVTDHELYGEVAPNLSSVAVVHGEGEGMVRRCVDADGNEWTETCTRWDEGRGFAVAVDVAESPFHRRLFTRFEGEWRVEERPGGALVTIEFDFDPRFGPLGVLVSWYVEYRARTLVEAILEAWAAEMTSRVGPDATAVDPVGSERGR
jgi:ribosome-associated toxin RatA of RatAB toxin-antitoxin module